LIVERPVLGVDLLALHAANPQRYPYLLESSATDSSSQGNHWSILFAFPGEVVRAAEGAFLSRLDQQWQQAASKALDCPSELPFCGGWFLFLDYELAHQIEPVLSRNRSQPPTSQAYARRVPAAILIDHNNDRLYLVEEGEESELVQKMEIDIQQESVLPTNLDSLPLNRLSEESSQQFLDGIERIKRYIIEGDVFQVNLSRQWEGTLKSSVSPGELYQRLRRSNPAPFSGIAVDGEQAVISSSPERLVRVRDGVAETRPIAGTHPRGATDTEDQKLSSQLLDHPKEQAEHVMLIDLERNDLGRVCQPGSIEVNELMVLESYAHVHHIVSNVRGVLATGTTPGAVIRALFPGGTITGCPKVRCMEIIDELESAPRHAYTGSMGYLNHNGDLDLNILIRTIMQDGKQIQLRAGAGIVHDSIPQRELEETRAKAKGMLVALGAAE